MRVWHENTKVCLTASNNLINTSRVFRNVTTSLFKHLIHLFPPASVNISHFSIWMNHQHELFRFGVNNSYLNVRQASVCSLQSKPCCVSNMFPHEIYLHGTASSSAPSSPLEHLNGHSDFYPFCDRRGFPPAPRGFGLKWHRLLCLCPVADGYLCPTVAQSCSCIPDRDNHDWRGSEKVIKLLPSVCATHASTPARVCVSGCTSSRPQNRFCLKFTLVILWWKLEESSTQALWEDKHCIICIFNTLWSTVKFLYCHKPVLSTNTCCLNSPTKHIEMTVRRSTTGVEVRRKEIVVFKPESKKKQKWPERGGVGGSGWDLLLEELKGL